MTKMKLGICVLVVLILLAVAGGCYWYMNLREGTEQGGILVYEDCGICTDRQKC